MLEPLEEGLRRGFPDIHPVPAIAVFNISPLRASTGFTPDSLFRVSCVSGELNRERQRSLHGIADVSTRDVAFRSSSGNDFWITRAVGAGDSWGAKSEKSVG